MVPTAPAKTGPWAHRFTLTVMVGIPGAGKTAWIERNLPRSIARVSPDEVRKRVYGRRPERLLPAKEAAVWAAVLAEVAAHLGAGTSVVVDSTAVTKAARKQILRVAEGAAVRPTKVAVFLDTPLGVAARRNAGRKEAVPGGVVERMAERLVAPAALEGFDLVIRVEPTAPG